MSERLAIISDCYSTIARQREILHHLGYCGIKAQISNGENIQHIAPEQLIWAHNVDQLSGLANIFMCSDGRLPSRLDASFHSWCSRVERALADRERKATKVVVLAASTGGPQMIAELLGLLGKLPDTALIVVQHQSEFVEDTMLKRYSELSDWQIIKVDKVVNIAPRCCYYIPSRKKIDLSRQRFLQPSVHDWSGSYAPSIDHIVGSLARVYSNKLMVVYLTGLEGEGPLSARIAESFGSRILLQDRDSAIAKGMLDAIAKVITNYKWVHPSQFVSCINEWAKKGT